MKRILTLILGITSCMLVGKAFADFPKPTLELGDQFTLDENIQILSPVLGQGAYITVQTHSTFEVRRITDYTQKKVPGSMTYHSYELKSLPGATLTGKGIVNATLSGITINGPVQIINGDYNGVLYYEESSMHTVGKRRVIKGNAQYNPGGFWVTISPVLIVQGEEYDPPMPEMHFPMAHTSTMTEHTDVWAFGKIDVQILGTASEFVKKIPVDGQYANRGTKTFTFEDGSTCDAVDIGITASNDANMTFTDLYCCQCGFLADNVVTGLPLGESGRLHRLGITMSNYNVAGDACTEVGGTPTPVATATPLPGGTTGVELLTAKASYAMLDQVIFQYRVWNQTSTAWPHAQLYILLELGGTFYWFPSFVVDGVDFTPKDLPTGTNSTTTFLDFINPGVGGGGVPLNWYALLINGDNGHYDGGVVSMTATLQ